MLEKLTLTNFQSHEQTEIAFGDRVTVIHGPSDQGKSAIFRALDWVCNNGLEGDYFLSSWLKRGGRCAVSLTVDGQTITRERSKSENLYKLGETEYKAFGKTVPDSIATHLNLSAFTFQRQKDQPFLISGTGSEAVEVFNSAAGLSDIDTVEAELRIRKNANDTCIRSADEQIVECESKLRETEPWVELHRLVQTVDTLKSALADAINCHARAEQTLMRLDALQPTVTLSAGPMSCAGDALHEVHKSEDALKRAQDALQSFDALKPCVTLSDTLMSDLASLSTNATASNMHLTIASSMYERLIGLKPSIPLTEPVFPTGIVITEPLQPVKNALLMLDGLKPSFALETPVWPERPTTVDYKNVAVAIARLDTLQPPDTDRLNELENELAQIAVCPECGALHEHWQLEGV